jgi:hypothetical protein
MIVIVLIGAFLTLVYAVLLGLCNYSLPLVLPRHILWFRREAHKKFTGYFRIVEEPDR